MAEGEPILFDRARCQAEEYAKDERRVFALLEEAQRKADRYQQQLDKALEGLQAFLRLIGAWLRGRYRVVPWRTVVLCIAAVIYFVNPFDLIPDFLPMLGFLDDAGVVAFVLQSIRRDIDDFLEWERINVPR